MTQKTPRYHKDPNMLVNVRAAAKGRMKGVFHQNGIVFLGQLVNYSREDIALFPNTGIKTVQEISAFIQTLGDYALRAPETPPLEFDSGAVSDAIIRHSVSVAERRRLNKAVSKLRNDIIRIYGINPALAPQESSIALAQEQLRKCGKFTAKDFKIAAAHIKDDTLVYDITLPKPVQNFIREDIVSFIEGSNYGTLSNRDHNKREVLILTRADDLSYSETTVTLAYTNEKAIQYMATRSLLESFAYATNRIIAEAKRYTPKMSPKRKRTP